MKTRSSVSYERLAERKGIGVDRMIGSLNRWNQVHPGEDMDPLLTLERLANRPTEAGLTHLRSRRSCNAPWRRRPPRCPACQR